MKRFFSVLIGLFNLGMILLFIMAAIFYSGALANKEGAVSDQFQFIITLFLMVTPIVVFGLHLYGQRLWWSEATIGVAKPFLLMFFSVFSFIPLFALVFLTLG